MDSPVVQVATAAAREAGVLLQSMLSESRATKQVKTKRNPADLVTRADRMAEAIIVRHVQAQFPDHGVLAEEGTAQREGVYRWIIDPLDGTTNFVHGVPWFAVSIGLEHEGQIIVGVVYHPGMDEMFIAERGRGARLEHGHQKQPIRVSDFTHVADGIVATGLPLDVRETGRNAAEIAKLAQVAIELRIMGAAALHLAYVAAGRIAAFWEPGLNPWDVAAGSLLVEEAGGRITDMRGRPFRLECRDVLATNGRVHEEMVRALHGTESAR